MYFADCTHFTSKYFDFMCFRSSTKTVLSVYNLHYSWKEIGFRSKCKIRYSILNYHFVSIEQTKFIEPLKSQECKNFYWSTPKEKLNWMNRILVGYYDFQRKKNGLSTNFDGHSFCNYFDHFNSLLQFSSKKVKCTKIKFSQVISQKR